MCLQTRLRFDSFLIEMVIKIYSLCVCVCVCVCVCSSACRCHGLGSVGSCDQVTGSCECNLLATGPLCDRCLVRFMDKWTTLFWSWTCYDSQFHYPPSIMSLTGLWLWLQQLFEDKTKGWNDGTDNWWKAIDNHFNLVRKSVFCPMFPSLWLTLWQTSW